MRVITFIILIVLSTILPVYFFAGLAALYSLRYHAYELILLAVMVDAYFGAAHVVPQYTIIIVFILLIVEWAKPHLLVYTT